MAAALFDPRALELRRRRAERLGPELFIHERVLDDILERMIPIQRDFRSALAIGWPASHWSARLQDRMASVTTIDSIGELSRVSPGSHDLCIVLGELDTADDLPLSLAIIRYALCEEGLLIGAIPGGETLPVLRSAMRAADERIGAAAPHVHPRIEAAAFAALLSQSGFVDPVVDLDRVQVSYEALEDLVADLRRMAATNALRTRTRLPLSREAVNAAQRVFAAASQEGRTTEVFELLHFAAWTPPDKQG